jgi:predicted MPP superfamily phosphohydrolase
MRRRVADRPRAPEPRGPHARPKKGIRLALYDLTETSKRVIYPLRLGRWLRQRLERDRRFHQVDLHLSRGGQGLHGLRIALIADVHAGPFMDESDLCRIFDRIAALEPDLVCMVGDLVENRAEQVLLLGKAISLLRPPLGVFAVPGNHDYDSEPGLKMWRATLQGHGVTVLLNAGQRLERGGESLWIAGVDDLDRGEPDLAAALRGVREEEPVFLLSHNPDLFCEASWSGVDLTLSGHTHGGQITLFGWTPLQHTRLAHWRGHFEDQGAQLYVATGTGITGIPLRVHAPGEVPLIRVLTHD